MESDAKVWIYVECQLLYGCVYRMSAVVWMCVQSVSCFMDVCTGCQLLYGCVYRMSAVVWMCVQGVICCMDVCTGCQLKSLWEILQEVGCIPPHMLGLPDLQMRKPRLKH